MGKTTCAVKMMPLGLLRNVDHGVVRKQDSIVTRYMVAVLGAWTAEAVTYPLDLLKTRIQIQSEVAGAKHGYKLQNFGMVKTALGVVKTEGFFMLWRGVSPMLQRHIVNAGSRLVIYESLRNFFRDEKGKLSLPVASCCAVAAGAMAQCVANPTDLVKVQMQAEGRRKLLGMPPRFKNCRHCYRVMYQEAGILGFWRGAIPSIQRAGLVTIGDMAAYDQSKQFLMRTFGMADNAILHGCSAMSAGLVAALLATPADFLRTRLMNQPVGPDGKGLTYRGMIDCLRQSVKNEGIFSLYKGFVPLWMRLGPWALVYWIAFENIMLAIGGKTF